MTEESEENFMTIASWLYYDSELTQDEIAKELNLSRTKVIRLLQKARRLGIVKIILTRSLPGYFELERRLKGLFQLTAVSVVNTRSTREETYRNIGRAGADTLEKLMFPGCKLGLAWSQTVSWMVSHISKRQIPGPISIHELAGTYLDPSVPYGVSWRVAERLGAPLESIPVPVLVENQAAQREMLKEERIRKALSNAGEVDVAFVGLGTVEPDTSLAKAQYLSRQEIDMLREHDVAGDILMRFFDQDGKPVPTDLDKRTISLTWEEIRKIPTVVAMAAGPTKTECVYAALKGKFINGLVTDSLTAQALINRCGD